jgi:hypothetical protein
MTALKFLVGMTEPLYGQEELMSTSLIFLFGLAAELIPSASVSA